MNPHDFGCKVGVCAYCGHTERFHCEILNTLDDPHTFEPCDCSCGLDALLAADAGASVSIEQAKERARLAAPAGTSAYLFGGTELDALIAAVRAEAAQEIKRPRRACECTEPDPVQQADMRFYCYRCSFETGARPHLLEPEATIRELAARLTHADQRERDVFDAGLDIGTSRTLDGTEEFWVNNKWVSRADAYTAYRQQRESQP